MRAVSARLNDTDKILSLSVFFTMKKKVKNKQNPSLYRLSRLNIMDIVIRCAISKDGSRKGVKMKEEVNMVGEKILVIDDNQDFLAELNELLDCSGYCPTVVSDPMMAVSAARSLEPDLILLDLKMSGINGFHVAERLKKSAETADTPIICMSGYFPVDKQETLLDISNMEACIKKPFGVLELLKQIETVLAAARRGKGMFTISETVGY